MDSRLPLVSQRGGAVAKPMWHWYRKWTVSGKSHFVLTVFVIMNLLRKRHKRRWRCKQRGCEAIKYISTCEQRMLFPLALCVLLLLFFFGCVSLRSCLSYCLHCPPHDFLLRWRYYSILSTSVSFQGKGQKWGQNERRAWTEGGICIRIWWPETTGPWTQRAPTPPSTAATPSPSITDVG